MTDASQAAPAPGHRLGEWTLLRPVAAREHGASVFEARGTRGRAAVKVLPRELASRAANEIRALAALSHPSIPRLLEHGDAPPWLAMEWIDGGELPSACPADLAVPAFAQVLGALAHAHSRGILHGDLRPENLHLAARGRVVVLDFGLSARIEPAVDAAHAPISGTPAYLAPERLAGQPATPQADIHSAAAVMVEIIAGAEGLALARAGRLDRLRGLAPRLLAEVLAVSLAEDPSERPASAADALRRILPLLPAPLPPHLSHLAADAELRVAVAGEMAEPALAGRTAVLSQLVDVLDATSAGRATFALVTGETGVGKTRLLAELARRAPAHGVRVLWGRCAEKAAPGGAYREALSILVGELSRRSEDDVAALATPDARALSFVCPDVLSLPWVRSLPELADLSPDLNKFRYFSAVTSLLRNWSRHEPLLLVLDDVQWADDATVELTYYLLRNVVSPPPGTTDGSAATALSIAVVRGPGGTDGSPLLERTLAEARRGSHVVFDLQRLAAEEVRDLVRSMLPGSAPPAELLDLVVAESGGMPHVAVELVASLHAEGILRRVRGEWTFAGARSAPSDTLTDLLRRRIERTSPTARRVLGIAALLGREFDAPLALEAAGIPAAQGPGSLEELAAARLCRRGRSGWQLAHDQLRQLVTADLEPDERAADHSALARALEDRSAGRSPGAWSAGEIVRHFLAAGESRGALAHLSAAVSEARTAGNSTEALSLLRAQIDLLLGLPKEERQRRLDEVLAAREALAEILQRQGRFDEATAAYLELLGACRGAGRLAAEARALVGLGKTANLAGDYADARGHLVRALELAGLEGARRTAVEARVFLVQNAYMRGAFDEAEPLLETVVAGAREIGERTLTAEALRQVGLFHHFRGRTEKAIACYREALQLLTDLGDRRTTAATLHNLGILHNARGEYHVAMDCYERSLPIFREMGLSMETAKCLNNIGNVHLQQGALASAERCYLETQSIYRELEDRRSGAENLSNLGEVDRRRGDYVRARERHRQALAVHRDIGNRAGISTTADGLVRCLLRLGQLDEAERLIAEALDIDREIGNVRGLAYDLHATAHLHRARSEDREALDALRQALRHADQAGDRFLAVILASESAELLVRLGDRDRAHAEARRALVDATSLGALEEQTLALLTLAEAGPASEWRERLDRALALVARAEDPETAWRAWHRAAVLRREHGDLAGALGAIDRSVETIATVARRLGDEAPGFLAHPSVGSVLDELLALEEAAEHPRLDALLDRYHLLATDSQRGRAKQVLARGIGPQGSDEAELRRLRAFREVVTSADLLSLDGLLSAFLLRTLELVGAERGLLFLRRDDQLACRVALARGGDALAAPEREVPRQVVEWVLRERAGLVTEDVAADRRIDHRGSVADLRVKSLLAAPLMADGEIAGVVYVDRRASGARFPREAREDFEATCADLGRLVATARRAEEREAEVRALRERYAAPEASHGLPGLLGTSPAVRQVFATARIVAASSESVLVTGPSGTGKEVLARALHAASPRASRPFVALDCGAVPESLMESVLFGHVRGAFTGADRDRPGIFEEADGGTLFLDEITNASRDFQARLLRVIQEREVRRVGGKGTVAVDVRIVSATNQDLEREVREGRFREDLFYRLNVIHLALPPLAERREDVPILAEHFLRQVASRDGKPLEGFTEEALRELSCYSWPGNVRELANCVARMAAFCDAGQVGAERIPERIRAEARGALQVRVGADASQAGRIVSELTGGRSDFWTAVRDPLRGRRMTKDVAREIVAEGLRRTGGSYRATARLFGLAEGEYTRFMDFLRFNDLKLDFRGFRTKASK